MPNQREQRSELAAADATLRRDRILAVVVTTCVVLATVASWALFRGRENRDVSREREDQADALINSLTAGYAQTEAVLSTANALVDPSGTVDVQRLETFAKVILAPGLASALAYEPIVRDESRAQFEARLGSTIVDRGPDGGFVPAPRRAIYYPVAAVQPDDESARRVLGFDIAQDPLRGDTARIAADMGVARVTPVVELAPSNRPGFLIVQPLKRADGPVVGFITIGYVGDAAGQSVLAGLPAGTRIRVADEGNELYRSADAPRGTLTRALPIGGRTWQITLDLPTSASRTLSTAILASGLATAALAALLARLSLRNHRALLLGRQQIARERDLAAVLALAVTSAEVTVTAAETIASIAPAAAVSIGLIEGPELHIQHSPNLGPSVTERWRSIPLRSHTPFTDAVRSGQPVVFGSIDEIRAAYPDVELDSLRAARALVCQPLAVGHRVIGAIAFGYDDVQQFDDARLRWLDQISAMVAGALERARLYDAQAQVALTLQRDLLPAALPELSTFRLSAAYRPGGAFEVVGGDWYDAFELGDGRLAITIGDVAGKGVRAAASMGKIRHVLRACAGAYREPGLVVGHANRLICVGSREVFATACYLTIDPNGECRFALAGHPPPLRVGPNGAQLVHAKAGAPLGVAAVSHYTEGVFQLGDDERVVLYTDGLVERRDEDIDRSLGRLVEVAGGLHAVDAESLVAAMGDNPLDDVVVLVVARVSSRDQPATAAAAADEPSPSLSVTSA